MSTHESRGTFDIDLKPADALVPDTGRFTFTKTWSGGLEGTGQGTMLSAGDPSTGTAGYVALEDFTGTVDGREGSFALQQFGTMADGDQELHYVVCPGSGTGALQGISGEVELEVVDGVHEVVLRYDLPAN